MWTRLLVSVALLLGGLAFHSPPVHAACVVETSTPAYADGTNLRDDKCDATGARKVTTAGGGISSIGTANAAAPTLVEAAVASFSFDLSGNARFTLGTLLSGENQTYQFQEIGWGVVRSTSVASGLLIAADCTSHCTPAAYVALPIGPKTFTSTISSATSGDTIVKQTHSIYGGNTNTFTNDDAVLLCTITFTATTQYLTKAFTKSCDPVTGNWSYYGVISSNTGSGAGVVTGAVTATY